jgi:hypothetical protein
MTTIDDVLAIQKQKNVLYPPAITTPTPAIVEEVASSSGSLTVSLYNSTTSNNAYAYITGLATSYNSCLFLLQSDGETAYYPKNPSSNGSALQADCAIALGAPGTTRTVTIPYIAGGRIWFCVDNTLTFLLNPSSTGPGLVEPSVSNTSDPNYYLSWDFCEFTYTSSQLYANISYVDFACLPIALTLTSTTGVTSQVGGLPSDGLTTICNNLIAQNHIDGAGWDQLVITNNGTNLRALSPTNGIVFNSSLFENYWTEYIDQVWTNYISNTLTVDTQSSWGVLTGKTSSSGLSLTFPSIGCFSKPAACDIFGASSGAFAPQATNTAELLNIGARLDAAINRSTLLLNANQPDGEVVSTYYTYATTNHYARIVHAANVDGRGYTFPYDDVTPDGEVDQSGFVSDGSPATFLVTVGGGNAVARREEERMGIEGEGLRMWKRSLAWEGDEKVKLSEFADEDSERDLEKGEHPKLWNEMPTVPAKKAFELPPVLESLMRPYINVSSPVLSNPLAGRTNSFQKFSASPIVAKCLRSHFARFCLASALLLSYSSSTSLTYSCEDRAWEPRKMAHTSMVNST